METGYLKDAEYFLLRKPVPDTLSLRLCLGKAWQAVLIVSPSPLVVSGSGYTEIL